MTPMLRNREPTIKTRLFTALNTGDVLLPAPFAAGLAEASIEVAVRFGCAVTTAKRYLQEYQTNQTRCKGRYTGYENPHRNLAARIVNEALADDDWEWLEGEVAANLLDLMFPFSADVALAGLRRNGF